MKELIIDTSSNTLYVGLNNDGHLSSVTRKGNNDNAAFLINKIDELLKENKITIDDITTIIVGVGPGSYTGARVAVVVAKTIASTKKITLKTISSLNLLSSGYANVTAAIDARRKHYYVGTYNNGIEVSKDEYKELEDLTNVIILNKETIKVDINVVSKVAQTFENVHTLEPNYLRKTEAETNYDQKNDN